MHQKSVAQLAAGLAAGQYSSVELTRHFLERIAQHDELNAFITVSGEQALTAASKADSRRANGEGGPLSGIPLVHKDIFCTRQAPTTCGSKMLADFVSPYDATVVRRLDQAGMIMLAKANMDEFAMGSSTENSFFGPTRNPWDLGRVPGGSSGGSAAAVAGRLAPVATGTDTGGSVRQPAALCGITGLKPTYGRVSRYGMVAFASSLDQAGILCQTAEDAALLLGEMAGFDAQDSTSADVAVPDYRAALTTGCAGLRIGVPRQFFESGLDEGVAQCVHQALEVFQTLGAKLVEIELPNLHLSVPAYYVVAPAEASSNLARFDGVRYGYRCSDPVDLADLYSRTRAEGFGAEVKRRIMIGTYVLSAGYYDAYYLQAQKVRQLISADFRQAFADVDLVMGPTAPATAFELGANDNDPISMYLSDIYTTAASLAGLPAMSIPCGFSSGLPVGLQIIGDHFDEARLLAAAHQYQSETDWHLQSPTGF